MSIMHKCVTHKNIMDKMVEVSIYVTKTNHTKLYDIVLKADDPIYLYGIRHNNITTSGLVMYNDDEKKYILVWDTYSTKKDAKDVYDRIEKVVMQGE